MIHPLLILMASPLLLQVQQGVSCTHRDYFETHLEVKVNKKPINYIRDVTLGELHSRLKSDLYERQKEMGTKAFLFDGDTDSMNLLISGTTGADIKFDTEINFLALPQNPKNSRYCLIFKNVTVNIDYQTDMTIAKELQEGNCAYDAVLKHQMKHHEANQKVVDALVENIKAEFPSSLPQLERNYVEKKEVKATYEVMIEGVEKALEPYQENMYGLIEEYGAFIDTPEELKALANSCKK